MTQPSAPTELDWPKLLDLAARVGVRVWRYDKKIGRLVQVASLDDPGTNPSTGSEEGDNE